MNTTQTGERSPSPALQMAIDRVLKGARDPETMYRAAERMDRERETMPQTNVAVTLVREARDER